MNSLVEFPGFGVYLTKNEVKFNDFSAQSSKIPGVLAQELGALRFSVRRYEQLYAVGHGFGSAGHKVAVKKWLGHRSPTSTQSYVA